jgi:hypothetical protein
MIPTIATNSRCFRSRAMNKRWALTPDLPQNADVGPACDTHPNRMDAMNTVRNIRCRRRGCGGDGGRSWYGGQRSDTGTRAGIPDTRAVRAGTAGGQTYPMTVNEGAR